MNTWLRGLINAAIGGAATCITNYAITPNPTLKGLGISALIGAVLMIAGYIQQSPFIKS